MITHESLTTAGFKRSEPTHRQKEFLHIHADALYQKKVREGGNTLYFVNVWYYFHGKHPSSPVAHGWEPEVQFNNHGGRSPTFNAVLFVQKETTVADVEAFFRRMYDAMGCEPYERGEDT